MNAKFWMIIVLVLVLISFLWFISQRYDERGDSFCDIDEDCVKVQTTCCPCSMGGEEICVSKSEVEVYENKIKEECNESGIICPAVYNCDDKDCECVDGICQ